MRHWICDRKRTLIHFIKLHTASKLIFRGALLLTKYLTHVISTLDMFCSCVSKHEV